MIFGEKSDSYNNLSCYYNWPARVLIHYPILTGLYIFFAKLDLNVEVWYKLIYMDIFNLKYIWLKLYIVQWGWRHKETWLPIAFFFIFYYCWNVFNLVEFLFWTGNSSVTLGVGFFGLGRGRVLVAALLYPGHQQVIWYHFGSCVESSLVTTR